MAFVIKIIPLILIKFFAIIMISAILILEEIQVSEKIISEIVILVWVLGMKFMTGKIIWRAFYLIEKLIQQKKILIKEKNDEKDFSNGYSYIDYGNDTSIRYVWG